MRRTALTRFASVICIFLCAISSAASQNVNSVQPDQMHAAQAPSNPAMDAFELALSSHPDDVAAQHGEVNEAISQALTLRNAGHMNSALAVLARARAYVPNDSRLLMDFGLQADAMHLYSDADKALSKAHQLAPGDAQILYGLARVELDEQKMPQAETDLRAYLAMNPDDPTAHYGLGHLLHMLQRDDEAERELQQSIHLQPEQTESWYQLGEIALSRNQSDQAKQDYEKVLQRDPNHGGALTGLGILAYRAKDYPTASEYLSRAINVAPNYPAAHRFYAMVLAREGQHQQSAAQEAIADDLTARQNKLQHGYILLAAPGDHP